jgi:predicted transglutaminase-like protease
MALKKRRIDKREQSYKNACREGYCPTLAERENNRIRELAYRLKADSKKETLTNISEWHNDNITYWYERYPLSNILLVLIFISSCSLILSCTPRFWWLWWLVAILGTATATLLAITILMIINYRKISRKHFFDIFRDSISTDFLLDKKLAVCRDYAKLAASLLFNIYPETDIYFVHARAHVTIGIIVEKKPYILDKYLPLTTIDRWHERWHKCRFSTKKVEKAKGTCLESVPLDSLLLKTSQLNLDTDTLGRVANKLERLLSVQNPTHGPKKGSLKLWEWKKGAILYEDDEIVNYSLAQRLKTILSKEMIDINHVANITIDKKKDDLIFRIKLK